MRENIRGKRSNWFHFSHKDLSTTWYGKQMAFTMSRAPLSGRAGERTWLASSVLSSTSTKASGAQSSWNRTLILLTAAWPRMLLRRCWSTTAWTWNCEGKQKIGRLSESTGFGRTSGIWSVLHRIRRGGGKGLTRWTNGWLFGLRAGHLVVLTSSISFPIGWKEQTEANKRQQ